MTTTLSNNRTKQVAEIEILYVIAFTALLFFFLSDAISKVLFTYSFEFHRVSLIIRTVYELLFIFLIVAFGNYVRVSILLVLSFLFVLFAVGQFLLAPEVRGIWIENLITFNKYIFTFIIYATFYSLQKDEIKLAKCISLLEILFVINSFAVLAGPITNWEFLKTYVYADYRHGYMGFIVAQNEATLYFFLAVSLAYYRRYVLGISNYRFFIILFASLLLGTKGIYLFLALLFVFHSWYYARNKILLILAIGFSLVQLYQFAATEQGRTFFVYFYNENMKRDFFSMLLSGRDILLANDFFGQIGEWSLVNYFVGGQNVLIYLTELDFFDLFLFFGIIGSIVYIALYFFTIFKFRKTKFTVFFVSCYFVLAFFGGHFFTSAVNGIYLCLIAMYMYATQYKSAQTSSFN